MTEVMFYHNRAAKILFFCRDSFPSRLLYKIRLLYSEEPVDLRQSRQACKWLEERSSDF